jgi:hypothetical protein
MGKGKTKIDDSSKVDGRGSRRREAQGRGFGGQMIYELGAHQSWSFM